VTRKKSATSRRKPSGSKTSTARKTAASPSPEERFLADLLTRGEAARRDEHGDLPPGATHEIVDDPDGGPRKAVRRRFSIS
jgi:hypothetical protein